MDPAAADDTEEVTAPAADAEDTEAETAEEKVDPDVVEPESKNLHTCLLYPCFFPHYPLIQYSAARQDKNLLPHAEAFRTDWLTCSSMYSMSKVHKHTVQ